MIDDPPMNWPDRAIRHPSRLDAEYLVLKPLSELLKESVARELMGKEDLVILDVGCGNKPFYPFFTPFAREYIGVDIVAYNPIVDKVCSVEELDMPDESVDVLLCTSVLEHVEDPIKAVRQFHRVLRRQGVAFVSTHGAFFYHPSPNDYWRWTQNGLLKLFRDFGNFGRISILPSGGTVSGIFFLLVYYSHRFLRRSPLWFLRSPLVFLLNVIGENLDRMLPRLRDITLPYTHIPEFVVIARK